ncbi:AraC family transcriptional regulator [Hydrogenophaga sp. BPS33]|uniref:AraC family transcriptional regulator n=1 Tax=Hydrogenophaga sp. BPS33 TaxID=2651974 RepID=UPI00131F8452|nr:AraC family transcriptional regulator [Hydrogenophaga sp. BPS33]QHE84100.1 AraC family transcriptional regulator [Hydrogenophaga sp. BPS33]
MPTPPSRPPLDPARLLLGPAATPMAFVRAMVDAYQARGMRPTRALKQAQIAPEDLRKSNARITAAQMESVSYAAMQELDDEALGCFSRALPWGSYGMLARASLSAPSLGLALQRWCRHHSLLTDDVRLSLDIAGDTARLVLSPDRRPDALTEFCVVSVLRNIHGLASWYVDSRIPLRGARFPYGAPLHVDAYAVLFDGPSVFDANHAAIEFDASYLDLPMRRDEAAMNQMLQHALPLTVRAYRRDRLLVHRVRQLLTTQPMSAHNADDLASQLHVSARTLHRQLKDEGASLQALKDEARRQRATDLLLRTRRPIKQVAQATGFLNEKSFIRAFRGWTGRSPGEWRAEQAP